MSGIAGIMYRDGRPVQQADIEDMLSAIYFRGPDGQGTWINGAVGLGHCILRTTPESVYETQPFVNTRKDLVITADARIDNRDELVSSLNLRGRQSLLLSDSELILAAYEKWGEQCAAKLLGDFSFAIWDKGKQQLYCAVDYTRRRPFIYFNSGNSFIFSSQLSGLLPGKLVPDELNEVRLGSLFFEELAEIDKTTTLLKDIFYLPPGSYLLADKQSFQIRQYWNTDNIAVIRRNSDGEYQEECIATLEQAISCRLRSDNDSAVALSGGIDSSSIAALSKKLLHSSDNKQIAISGLSANEASSPESVLVRKAVLSLSKSSVLITPEIVNTRYTDIVTGMKRFDAPQVYQNIFLVCLYQTAEQHGLKVLLDGAESDTLLGLGGHYISHLFKNRKIKTAVREAVLRSRNTLDYPKARYEIIINSMRAAWFPNFTRARTYAIRKRINYKRLVKDSMINPSFSVRIDVLGNLSRAYEQVGYGITRSINEMRIRAFNRPFMSLMPVSTDMMSSAFSIDLRHPYLDRRFVEFSLGLPWDQKNRDGWEKYILRKSMENLVPDEIRWRRGRDHVGGEYQEAFIRQIYPELEAIINDKNSTVFEYYDNRAMQGLVNGYKTNSHGYAYLQLLNMYGLHNWINAKNLVK